MTRVPSIPKDRLRVVTEAPVRASGSYVLYWMTCARRTRWSFALQHAAQQAQALGRPLLILEALRVDYPHASDRLHRFVLDGMRDNAAAAEAAGVRYLPYVEPEPGHGRGLLAALAARACLVVTDEPSGFFLPRMLEAASRKIDARLEAVDGAGVLPRVDYLRAWPTAHGFRRHLQRVLPTHLPRRPVAAPLDALDAPLAEVPRDVLDRWPAADDLTRSASTSALARLPIDHGVPPVAYAGGAEAGREILRRFVDERLHRYGLRSHPDEDSASGLSPWLHFGHVSSHELVAAVLDAERWTPARAAQRPTGARAGWWGLSEAAEALLDQIITWRELGLTWAALRPDDYDTYDSVPDWARRSLAQHAGDPRSHLYTRAQLEAAETDDEIWNAAQRQLLVDGRIANYPRMLWGKNVIGWTRAPEEAAEVLKHLNDRWAVDGRDANSYSGIFWVFGRHDRAWGPERPIFGKVRYMTSANTKRKLRLARWLERWGPPSAQTQMVL